MRVEAPERADSHILVVRLGGDARAARWSEALAERGLRVPAIRFPTVPEGRARLRISIRADHSEADLRRLVIALAELAGCEATL